MLKPGARIAIQNEAGITNEYCGVGKSEGSGPPKKKKKTKEEEQCKKNLRKLEERSRLSVLQSVLLKVNTQS